MDPHQCEGQQELIDSVRATDGLARLELAQADRIKLNQPFFHQQESLWLRSSRGCPPPLELRNQSRDHQGIYPDGLCIRKALVRSQLVTSEVCSLAEKGKGKKYELCLKLSRLLIRLVHSYYMSIRDSKYLFADLNSRPIPPASSQLSLVADASAPPSFISFQCISALLLVSYLLCSQLRMPVCREVMERVVLFHLINCQPKQECQNRIFRYRSLINTVLSMNEYT